MREIIFRGKRVDNDELVEGYFVKTVKSESQILIPIEEGFKSITVIPETVGQFTGLKDKNGKKIFEGDCLKGREGIYVIEWSDNSAKFTAMNNIFTIYQASASIYEIIGNIHDNPELLEDKQMNNYIVINGKKAEVTEEQVKQLVITPKKELFEEGKDSWFLTSDGYILEEEINDCTLATCKKVYEQGNLFFSEEDAEFERDRRKYYYQVKHFLDEHNGKIDWNNTSDQWKYNAYYNTLSKEISICSFLYGKDAHSLYATSEEIMQQAIDLIGEENFKKYILEV